jgi:uncharacterized protein (TIGR02145 family)
MKAVIVFLSLVICYLTSFPQETGTFTDPRDNHEYQTVQICEKIWLAENLAYKPRQGNYWAYDNDPGNVSEYGYLYDWKTAKKVCPSGWHLASKEEYKTLLAMYGDDADDAYNSLVSNGNSGFSALLSGHCGSTGKSRGIDSSASFWTNTQSVVEGSNGSDDFLRVFSFNLNKKKSSARLTSVGCWECGKSVRCIQGDSRNESGNQIDPAVGNTQLPDLEGIWQKSVSGDQMQIKMQNYGFDCIFNDATLQARYFGQSKDGSSVYKADYGNTIVMLKIVSANEIGIVSTIDPEVRTWTRAESNRTGIQNGGNGIQNNRNQNTGVSEMTCTFCKGTGEYTCPACSGKGSHKKHVSTPNYTYGSKEIVKDKDGNYYEVHESHNELIDEPCIYCFGTGKQTCKLCNGTGIYRKK